MLSLALFAASPARADEPIAPPAVAPDVAPPAVAPDVAPPVVAPDVAPPLPAIPAAPGAYLRPRPAPPPQSHATALTQPGAWPARAERTRLPRIGFETAGAALGIGASAIVGVFGWGLAGQALCQTDDTSCAVAGALVFGAIASVVLVPLGVVVGSRATRGNGGYVWSMLGAALGLVPGIAAGYGLAAATDEPLSAIPVIAVLTMFGAVLGYELSADAPPTASERLFTPVASIDPTGFRIGFRGTL
jgi:hypothetical protein